MTIFNVAWEICLFHSAFNQTIYRFFLDSEKELFALVTQT